METSGKPNLPVPSSYQEKKKFFGDGAALCISGESVSSSLAKHGGALFSAVSWSIKDPIGAPGPYEPQEC